VARDLPVLSPPRGGGDIGDYSLRDFAAKWLVQQCDLAEIDHYSAANAVLAADGDRRRRVILMGDSITEFWADASGLEGATWRVLNRGIAGQNSTQMLLRFEDDVIALAPDLAILLCGTNDLRCYAGPPASIAESALARIRRNVTAIADIAAGRNLPLILATLPPVGVQSDVFRDPDAILAVNDWIARFAVARGLETIDYHGALVDSNGHLPPALSEDGVHPNGAGYDRMMKALRPALAARGFEALQSLRRVVKAEPDEEKRYADE
jgi:acyl-CoA thioesterase I